MKKRLTALLLVLSLVLSLGATVAFATDEDDVPVDPVVDDPIVEDPVVDDPVEDDPDGDESQKARVDALYGQLMAAQSTAEVAALAEDMTDAEISAFLSALTEDENAALEAHLNDLAVAEYVLPETVVFTDAGPFMPAVNVAPVRRLLRAPATYQNDPEPADNGLVTQKTVTANDDGTYTIRLESWTTGKVTTSTKTIPVDIVLVLDQSGSMAFDFSGNTTNTNSDRRQYAMKQAVNNFIEKVAEKYSTDADHRMAIVTFGSNASTLQGWTVVDAVGMGALQNEINRLPDAPSGATNVAAGMTQAETLMGSGYSYNGTNTQRQKVVIVFTDGVPTTSTDFDTGVATSAIATAKSLKDDGATVYTVGIFNGANPDELYGASGFDRNSDGTVNSKWVKDTWGLFPGTDFPEADRPAGNRFLNLLSSNYESADSIGLNRATKGLGILRYKITYTITQNYSSTGSGYYLTAKDSTTLNGIFQTISNNIQTANIDLGSATVVKDVVTDYFDLPANASAITLYSAAAKADGTFDTPVPNPAGVTATVNNNAVTVTGFDYNANFVSKTDKGGGTYGKKLIVEFTITPKQDFLGGDNVPTNVTASSGLYDKDGALVENYPNPGGQNVPVKTITPAVQDLNVYLASSTDLTGLLRSFDSRINGTNNAFVTVTYTIKDGDTIVGTYTIPAGASTGSWSPATVSASPREDKTYTVACEVKPATSAAATAENSAKVNVFKPELTYQDATIYLGNSAPDFNSLRVGDVVWKNGTTLSTSVTMTGTAPTLNITYDKSTTGLTACTDVNATVKIGGTDVTESVKFWNYGEERGKDKAEFTVHVLKPSFQTTDVTIYLHNSTNLDDRVTTTTTGWSCVSEHDGSVTVPAVQGDAPAIAYSFQVNNAPVSNQTAYAPTECVNVAVTPKVGSVTLNQENLTFDVHVLYPSFEVTVNDVWANYGVNVNLKDNCIAAPVITWNDKNSTAHTPGQVEGTAPISASTAFTFTCEKVSGDGSLENGIYTTGVQDADFKVTGIAYHLNDQDYSWNVTVKDAEANAASHFTVHINHFDLVVNKTWSGDSIYRQDAIFTLTDTTANTSMKVVVPATTGTVTIKNLVCGKTYSVAEDGNWAWRFLCGEAQNVACEAAHGITRTAPGAHTVTKSFVNTLNLFKWLDGSAYCNNNFADLNP